MNILGISYGYHDAAACLLIDGFPVSMAQEERFTRKKNDSSFPRKSLEFILAESGLSFEKIDAVVYYEKPFLKFERQFRSSLATFPSGLNIFKSMSRKVLLESLWVKSEIKRETGIQEEKIFFSSHHLSHAAAAYLSSPFDDAAILTVDGVGEKSTTMISKGEEGKIIPLKELKFPHSLGLLYSAFTAFLGFRVNNGEYKVMGMAPYGSPRYVEKIRKIISFHKDGSFELDMSYFSFDRSLTRPYTSKFVRLFGKPRDRKSKFFTRNTGWPSYFGKRPEREVYEKIAKEQEYFADVASSLQKVTEDILLKLVQYTYVLTRKSKLCFGGGVALNSVANWRILQEGPFDEIFIQPSAGDAGSALGAALAYQATFSTESRRFSQKHAYYGQSFSEEEIRLAAKSSGYDTNVLKGDDIFEKVANLLIEGRVGAWFQGRFEWGPRSLGNRSIIADPRRRGMKDIVNTKIKFREPYRPFAPSVTEGAVNKFFDLGKKGVQDPMRYMLMVVPVKEEKRKAIPAVTHVDGSARIQIVERRTNFRWWKLIDTFGRKTGVPIILNTSFNLKGEPIVSTPKQAIDTFSRCGLDFLVMGNSILYKKRIGQ